MRQTTHNIDSIADFIEYLESLGGERPNKHIRRRIWAVNKKDQRLFHFIMISSAAVIAAYMMMITSSISLSQGVVTVIIALLILIGEYWRSTYPWQLVREARRIRIFVHGKDLAVVAPAEEYSGLHAYISLYVGDENSTTEMTQKITAIVSNVHQDRSAWRCSYVRPLKRNGPNGIVHLFPKMPASVAHPRISRPLIIKLLKPVSSLLLMFGYIMGAASAALLLVPQALEDDGITRVALFNFLWVAAIPAVISGHLGSYGMKLERRVCGALASAPSGWSLYLDATKEIREYSATLILLVALVLGLSVSLITTGVDNIGVGKDLMMAAILLATITSFGKIVGSASSSCAKAMHKAVESR